MKKRGMLVVVALVAMLFFTAQGALAAYDSAEGKASMQKVLRNFKELNARVTAKDYYGAAERFMDLAKLFKGLETMDPPMGDQTQWVRISDGIVNAAFKGIGACGMKDEAGIQQAIGEIVKLRDEGHKMFMSKKSK